MTITGADSSSELIIRGAVQLTGDHVTIQNVKLHFISTNALQSVVHREIFLAGHSLVLDSVDTYVKGGAGSGLGGFGGTEEELLPTVYAGGFKNTVVGQNASLTVTNAVENTKIQAVYMSMIPGVTGKPHIQAAQKFMQMQKRLFVKEFIQKITAVQILR